jgi:hypothetical protein
VEKQISVHPASRRTVSQETKAVLSPVEETIVIAMISSSEEAAYPAASITSSPVKESESDALRSEAAAPRMKKASLADRSAGMSKDERPTALDSAAPSPSDPLSLAKALAWEFAGSDIVEKKTDGRVTGLIFRVASSKIPEVYAAMESRGLAKKPFPPIPKSRLPVRVELRLP